jgi:hypothetical protein
MRKRGSLEKNIPASLFFAYKLPSPFGRRVGDEGLPAASFFI